MSEYKLGDKLLTQLKPSTITLQGKFKNVELTGDMVHMFILEGNILSASSNDGNNISPNRIIEPKKRKSNRGRKKKEKPKTKRCKNGKFGSMIQFEVKSIFKENKIYKIKVFNKETFQVPGVLEPDFSDVIPSLNELSKFLEKSLGSEEVKIIDITPIMRNYICKIERNDLRINLRILYNFILEYQNNKKSKKDLIDKIKMSNIFINNNFINLIPGYE